MQEDLVPALCQFLSQPGAKKSCCGSCDISAASTGARQAAAVSEERLDLQGSGSSFDEGLTTKPSSKEAERRNAWLLRAHRRLDHFPTGFPKHIEQALEGRLKALKRL